MYTLMGHEQVWATWKDAFSDSEIAAIIELGEARRQDSATINGDKLDETVRKTKVSWIEQNDATVWLYDKMGFIARQLNGSHYDFDLSGFGESFQYTVYNEEGSHYDWHMDKGVIGTLPPRKLSLVLQLSDPTEYEGGDLLLLYGKEAVPMERAKGLVVGFPSWILHKVTPITKGTRRSLVVWTSGPKFR
jgi:PKHD-type hydroxylase